MRVLQVAEKIGNSFQAGKGVRARSWLGCNWAGTTDDRSQADIDPDLEIPQRKVTVTEGMDVVVWGRETGTLFGIGVVVSKVKSGMIVTVMGGKTGGWKRLHGITVVGWNDCVMMSDSRHCLEQSGRQMGTQLGAGAGLVAVTVVVVIGGRVLGVVTGC
ncbi:hypothetical protein WR25_03779 [Diploscapter pachys]|uniref:Uncharacterized protein n=1 Tax=Diploscapter pachys TaxID=2018661 RepID=A0A2A2LNB5_9BILA|nr:hypothetical protein WR25_03779 [Diploscapter pachys]